MIVFRLPRPGFKWFSRKKLLFLLVLFLLVFPKGGVKLAGIPITWGYLLIGAVSIALARVPSQEYDLRRLQTYLLSLPFQALIAVSTVLNGFVSAGQFFAIFMAFHFLPFFFLALSSKFIEELDLEYFYKIFRISLLIVAIYGIFLFFVKNATGKFLQIPLLTTNLHDSGNMEDKHNRRGLLFKLISTYNNGNIYGACILILLPFFCAIEPKKWKQWAVKLSLFLTLSRTAWIGLILHEFVLTWFYQKPTRYDLIKFLAKGGVSILALISIGYAIGLGPELFLDRSMGGRDEMLVSAANASFFSPLPLAAISEAVYLSVTAQFGYVGLILFLAQMLAPLGMALSRGVPDSGRRVKWSVACGLINYLFICLSDGALIFIPTMAFYWFFSSLLLRRSFLPPLLNGRARKS